MPAAPVYAAAKAGVVQLTRSAAPTLLRRYGIRALAVCPEFVDTQLVRHGSKLLKLTCGLLSD